MKTIRLAILFSGNGSNLENIYTKMQGMEINSSLGECNSSLTRPSRELEKSSIDRRLALSHLDFSAQPTNLAQDTRIAERVESNSDSSDSNNSTESSLRENERSEFSWQSKQNNLHEVQTESRPIRGAKNRIQTSSSASADFLLESDKRGSPPKSEKAAAFWRVGGAGRGVQPFLQKDSNDKNSVDLKADLIAESHKKIDSKFALDLRDLDSSLHGSSRSAQNDDRVDYHDSIKLDFVLAVSSKDSAYGITRCANLGLKCEIVDYKQHKENFIPRIITLLEKNQIDLVILAGFMRILPPEFNAKFRAINIHPSILPLFKGAHAIEESYQSDMKIAGVSVHFVSDELDSGALIAQDIIHKIEGESLESFEARIHELEYKIYPKAIIKAIKMITKDSL